MTQPEVEEYVKILEPDFQKLYRQVYLFCRDSADTLSEEFQIAASIEDIFRQRAQARL